MCASVCKCACVRGVSDASSRRPAALLFPTWPQAPAPSTARVPTSVCVTTSPRPPTHLTRPDPSTLQTCLPVALWNPWSPQARAWSQAALPHCPNLATIPHLVTPTSSKSRLCVTSSKKPSLNPCAAKTEAGIPLLHVDVRPTTAPHAGVANRVTDHFLGRPSRLHIL